MKQNIVRRQGGGSREEEIGVRCASGRTVPAIYGARAYEWLGATVFWGNTETEVSVVSGFDQPCVALDFLTTSGHAD